MFDPQGNVVGIQIIFPDTFNIAKGWEQSHVREGNTFVMTAYFTDPNNVCSGNRVAPKGYIGDNLYLVMNNGPVKIPLKESDIGETKWTKGTCFYGMGKLTSELKFTWLEKRVAELKSHFSVSSL